MSEGFLFYKSYFESIEALDEKDQLAALKAIIAYGLFDELPENAGTAKAVVLAVKPVMDKNKKKAENGRAGGLEKAKRSNDVANSSKRVANASKRKQTLANKTQDIKHKTQDIKQKTINARARLADGVQPAVDDFIEHRKSLRSPMSAKAFELFIDRLMKLASTPEEQICLINTAIERGWKTVYPPDDAKKKPKTNQFNQFPQREYDDAAIEKMLLSG